jgi:uncharacterized protein (TIGR02217 family)
MFVNEIFDINISKTAYFKPIFETQINTIINKIENRQAKWQMPRNYHTMPTQVIKINEYKNLFNLFNVCKGRFGSFKFKNQFDYILDNIEITNSNSDIFEVFKLYKINNFTTKKLIKSFDTENFNLKINGQNFYDFNILEDGKIKINHNINASDTLEVSGEFFDVVRFDTDFLNAKFISHSNVEILEFSLIEV